jgi:hypothetical protein
MTSSNLKRKIDPEEAKGQGEQQAEAPSQTVDDGLQQFLTQRHPADATVNQQDRSPSMFFTGQSSSTKSLHNGYGLASSTGYTATLHPKPQTEVIDLTKDDDSPIIPTPEVVQDIPHVHQDEDYLLALQLQAQFNAENSDIVENPPGSPSKKQKLNLPAFNPEWQLDRGDSLPWMPPAASSSKQSTMSDEDLARQLQAQMDAEDANRMTDVKYRVAEASSTSVDASLPLDSQLIHEFADLVYKRRCPNCTAPLLHGFETLIRKMKKTLVRDKTITGSLTCQFCNFATCAGCGERPESTQMGTQNEGYENYTVGWHCDDGRRFVLWALLCMPTHSISSIQQPSTRPERTSRSGRSRSSLLAGVGYAGGRETPYSRGQTAPKSSFKSVDQADAELLPVLVALWEALPSGHKSSTFDQIPVEGFLHAIFRRSALFEKIAELLRNDSINDIAKRCGLYHVLVTFLMAIANHASTSTFLFHTRHLYPEKHGLMAISNTEIIQHSGACQETSKSLAQILETLVSQSIAFLIRARQNASALEEDEEIQHAVQVCERIAELGEFVAANNTSMGVDKSGVGKGKGKKENDMKEWFSENCVTEVNDALMLKHHHFAKEAANVRNPPKGRMKKLLMELTSLRTSLPPGIYVKHASSRIDVMKFLIIGPMGTPYENGIFEFDLFCPANYPNEPPKVDFKTTGGGRAHFNPNLYQCGKGKSLF